MSDQLHDRYASSASGGIPRQSAKPGGLFSRLKDWISQPMVEDYSLRYAPRSYRKWSEFTIAMTALGGIAYLADFAIGASIFLSYGFTSALWAILIAAVVIFATGLPIAYYSARYNLDMDLLTRGAGFGYLGSTWTSLIYASFCFIFFALEGAIMAQGLLLFFGIPLPVGYLICSLIFIPLVLFGMTLLSRLQVWTQPVWLTLLVLPFIIVAVKEPHTYAQWSSFVGNSKHGAGFDMLSVGLGAGIALSLIAQIGEQVDYLRFMPEKTPSNNGKWWAAVVSAGPGWVIIGALKQLGGGFLLSLIFGAVAATEAVEPIQQFLHGYQLLIPSPFVALAVATLFVVISQVKINVTNAYSGSLSWSNFFSRLLHRHPGRAVWLVLHVAIAVALMEGNVFHILNSILGFYSNVAIAWIGAVVADLVINKPILKISPAYIEFKRSNLHNFNPVGFGSMLIASAISIVAFFGLFGPMLQAFSPFLALAIAFVLSPVIALLTRGKYYLARTPEPLTAGQAMKEHVCTSCGGSYEAPDMSGCPFHRGHICSLCCTLESQCGDLCKTGEYRHVKLFDLQSSERQPREKQVA